ncbi:MAG TPA: tyrosine phenol-lyase, partial [Desulfitobacterium dehalogenans]|nr:tyrosine phenol-lyase [Desulfitobacterium dehalogenans]
VIVDGLAKIAERRDQIKGLEFVYEPKVLRHFLCKLKPIGLDPKKGEDVNPMVP